MSRSIYPPFLYDSTRDAKVYHEPSANAHISYVFDFNMPIASGNRMPRRLPIRHGSITSVNSWCRILPRIPNPFMVSHTPSPRMFSEDPTRPDRDMFLPIVPTIENWSKHLLNTGCSMLGNYCVGKCIPGEELERSNAESRFPLSTGSDNFSALSDEIVQARRVALLRGRDLSRSKAAASNRITKNSARTSKHKSKCWVCQKTFCDLDSHMKSHEKEKKFKCSTCGEDFPRKWILTQHLEGCV